jgi:hypothetical protein
LIGALSSPSTFCSHSASLLALLLLLVEILSPGFSSQRVVFKQTGNTSISIQERSEALDNFRRFVVVVRLIVACLLFLRNLKLKSISAIKYGWRPLGRPWAVTDAHGLISATSRRQAPPKRLLWRRVWAHIGGIAAFPYLLTDPIRLII